MGVCGGAVRGGKRQRGWLMESWLVYKGLQRALEDNQKEDACRSQTPPFSTPPASTHTPRHTYTLTQGGWASRILKRVRSTDDEILKVGYNKRHLTRVATSSLLGVLFFMPPPPFPPHNITFPPLCSLGGRWVGELCYIPVYLFMTSSRQFCTW